MVTPSPRASSSLPKKHFDCWLEVFRKTSSIRNGPKLAAFPAYLGVRKHLGLTLAFREVEGSRNQASHSQSQQQKAAIQLQQAPR
jgi:hypothetical protein